jgi:hypothetical protein
MQEERCDVCCGNYIAITLAKRCVVKYNALQNDGDNLLLGQEDLDYHEDSMPWCIDCLGREQPEDMSHGDGKRIVCVDEVGKYKVDDLVEVRDVMGGMFDTDVWENKKHMSGLVVEKIVQCSSAYKEYGYYNVLVNNKIMAVYDECIRFIKE